MLKTVNFNDEAHVYIAKLEEENNTLREMLKQAEARNHTLEKELRGDAKLGAALRVILKELAKE